MLVFEWDEAKRARNLTLHGVDFDAVYALEWQQARYVSDERRNYGEGRIQGFAPIKTRVYVIVFTIRKTGLRIISLRKTNDRETERYERSTEV